MIDSHVHLDAKYYQEGGGVAEVLASAKAHGVDRFVTPSLHFESYNRLRELAAQHSEVFPAVGVHPHEVTPELLEDLTGQLESRLAASSVPILGETGLEGHYDFSPMDLQLQALRGHLEVAKSHGVPCILHCRSAEELLHQELTRVSLPSPPVIHCFTGSWEWAQRFLDLGCYIGITGIVTFKKADEVANVAARLPLDRLLVETDGPYLAPIPYRGRPNRPEYIPLIVEAIAALRGASPGDVATATRANTEKVFRLRQ